jgi:adenosine/AMP kinase
MVLVFSLYQFPSFHPIKKNCILIKISLLFPLCFHFRGNRLLRSCTERDMEITITAIEKPVDMNFILGQSHFIKTIEDLHETIVSLNGTIKFGIAFCESSGPALVRHSGNDKNLIDLAVNNALRLSCGHSFIIFMENGFPINILNAVKQVPEVCSIYCATANPVEVIIAETAQGRGILGVIDGVRSKGIEQQADIEHRKSFLRKIGYKF